ncbi:MAG: hypothetical protein LBT34_01895 [Clostridiales Family XIII bacterium]|jgi:hypothetical protein|nr:hypothetical protein [Clostridiales Family XIII bacterium]
MVEIFQKAYAEKPKRRRGKSKVFIVALSDSILAEFGGISLIDHYDVYEALMNYWDEAMQDDVCHQF